MLRDTAPGASLRIMKRVRSFGARLCQAARPWCGARKLDKNGDLELTWRLNAESKEYLDVWARWSNDEGKTWHALTLGQRGNSATIPAEQLPSGKVQFELFANDGFHTVRATTDAVTLPAKPPAVAILYPGEPRAYTRTGSCTLGQRHELCTQRRSIPRQSEWSIAGCARGAPAVDSTRVGESPDLPPIVMSSMRGSGLTGRSFLRSGAIFWSGPSSTPLMASPPGPSS